MTYPEDAACIGTDPETFAPDGWGRDYAAQIADAKRICWTCPVRQSCLDAAMAEEDGTPGKFRWTIRGGYTGPERARLARRIA